MEGQQQSASPSKKKEKEISNTFRKYLGKTTYNKWDSLKLSIELFLDKVTELGQRVNEKTTTLHYSMTYIYVYIYTYISTYIQPLMVRNTKASRG